MSRTYKHRPYKPEVSYEDEYYTIEYEARILECVQYDPYSWRYELVDTGKTHTRTCRVKRPGVYTKKKRSHVSSDDWWYRRTPSHWTHDFMTVPKRAACRNWEKDAVKYHDLEDVPICPDFGRKPHMYYW